MKKPLRLAPFLFVLTIAAFAADKPFNLPPYPGAKKATIRMPEPAKPSGSGMMDKLMADAAKAHKQAEQNEAYLSSDSVEKILAFYDDAAKKAHCSSTTQTKVAMMKGETHGYACDQGKELRILTVQAYEGRENCSQVNLPADAPRDLKCVLLTVMKPVR